VPARVGSRKGLTISRADEVRTLALIVVLTILPAAGTIAVIALRSQPDLSELTPVRNHTTGNSLLSWASLLRDPSHAPEAGSAISSGAVVELLGYMMDGNRPPKKGRWVPEFILLPETGDPIYPAHRFGDQMISVHLRGDAHVRFSPRALVWVSGRLEASSGDSVGDKPLNALEQARTELADRGEIRKYFK